MLVITVAAEEVYDESSQTFASRGGFQLELEHSLVSLSKWESEFEKPFLGDSDKTPEELQAYIEAMVLTKNPPGNFLQMLSKENVQEINTYIERTMTATRFYDAPGAPPTRSTITSELVYYWMTQFQIPFECDQWNLNRLFTLIRVCDVKSSKPKKMSAQEIARRNRDMNARRKERLGTKG